VVVHLTRRDRARESLAAGTSYLLDIDNEQFMVRVGERDVVATDATRDRVTATIAGKLRDFFAAAKGDKRAAQRTRDIGRSFGGQELVAGTDWRSMAVTP